MRTTRWPGLIPRSRRPAAIRQARSAYSAQVSAPEAVSLPAGRHRRATASGRAATVAANMDGTVLPAMTASMSVANGPMLSPPGRRDRRAYVLHRSAASHPQLVHRPLENLWVFG